jgi:transposase-like protein
MTVYADLTCPRCQSSGVTLFRLLRTSAVYLCSSCDHQWEGEPREPAPAPALALSSDESLS